jgi:hypothetical protein
MKSFELCGFWYFLRDLFLFIIDVLISLFHHGTRGLFGLLLAIPMGIFAVSVMSFESWFTSSSIFSLVGGLSVGILFSINELNRFQLASLTFHLGG